MLIGFTSYVDSGTKHSIHGVLRYGQDLSVVNFVPGTDIETLTDSGWEGYHESKRCSMDTYPKSYFTKCTSLRR